MTTPNDPSSTLIATEDFIRALERDAPEDDLHPYMEGDLRGRYLFVCQMLAMYTTVEQRKDWNMRFMTWMAQNVGGLSDQDIRNITGEDPAT